LATVLTDRVTALNVGRVRNNPVLTVFVAGVVLAAAHSMVASWSNNQNTYFVHAVAGDGPLRHDLLARSTDPVPVFTSLVGPVVRLFGGPLGVDLLWWLPSIAFFSSLCWITGGRVWRHRSTALLWVALVAALINPLTAERASWIPEHVLWGVAWQWALGGYLQPSVAAVAALIGCVLVIRTRQFLGLALVMVAAVVHPSFVVPAALLAGALVISELWGSTERRCAVRRVTPGLAAAGAILIIWAVANWDAIGALRGPLSDRANRILVHGPVRYHALPELWFGFDDVARIVGVALAAVLAIRQGSSADRRLGRFLLASLVLIAGSTIIVQIAAEPRLNLTFPWRASVVVEPVAAAWLLGLAAHWIASALRLHQRAKFAAGACAAVLSAIAIIAGLQATVGTFDSRAQDEPLVVELRRRPLTGVGLIPTDLENVRLGAGVPIFVDDRSHPVEPRAVVEWWHRLQTVNDAMQSPEALCSLVQRLTFGWVVVNRNLALGVASSCLSSWTALPVGDLVLFQPARPSGDTTTPHQGLIANQSRE
jgi:hypothetical protein